MDLFEREVVDGYVHTSITDTLLNQTLATLAHDGDAGGVIASRENTRTSRHALFSETTGLIMIPASISAFVTASR